MAVGDSAWSFALAPAGKVEAWLRISRRDDDWVLDIDEGFGEDLAARLTRFLMRTDATVAPVSWDGFAVRGADAAEVVPPDTTLGADPAWPGVEGIDLLGPGLSAPDGPAVGEAVDLETLRIESGVPAMGAELDQSTIPAATGVVERSVSFTKGSLHRPGAGRPGQLTWWSRPHPVVRRAGPGRPTARSRRDARRGRRRRASSRVPRTRRGGDATVALAYVKRAVEVPSDARAEAHGDAEAVRVGPVPHDLTGSGGDRRPALP